MAKSRKIVSWLIALIALVVFLWLILPVVLAPIIRHKLQALVSEHLNAELRIGSLRYQFPYGIRVRDVHLISTADQTEVFSAKSLEISLVKLPIRGPLVIKKIDLQQPMVQVIRAADGTFSGKNLIRPHPADQRPSEKLSDILQLRLLTITAGQMKFQDLASKDSLPMVWDNLSANLNLDPTSASQYAWDFTGQSGPLASIETAGTADIDEAIFDISKLVIKTKVGRDAPASSLPAALQKLFADSGVEGEVKFEATAHLPLKNLSSAEIAAAIELNGARANIGAESVALDAHARADKKPNDPGMVFSVQKLLLQTFATSIEVAQLNVNLDSNSNAWRISDLEIVLHAQDHPEVSGTAKVSGSISGTGAAVEKYNLLLAMTDLALAPHTLDAPIKNLTGSVRVADGVLTSDGITGKFGEDQINLQVVRVPLDNIRQRIDVRDLALAINFHQPGPHYPGKLREVLDLLNPAGIFQIRGRYAIVAGAKNESDLTLTTDNSSLTLAIGGHRMPVTNIQTDILVLTDQAQIRKFNGELLGGTISATGAATVAAPNQFEANVALRNVDVHEFAVDFVATPDKETKLAGRADMNLNLQGTPSDLNSIAGRGDVEVTDGNLWDISLLNGIVSRTKITREALNAGEAAAVFEIANSQVLVSKAAINSPAVGLQGSGIVKFNGKLDLYVIVAPLGDWKKQWEKTGVPFIGSIAGGFQKVVNTATSQLLYQFRVTGSASQPQVETVPAPFLTAKSAMLFDSMIKKKQALVDALRQTRE